MNTDCEYEVMRTNYVKYGGLMVQGKPGGKKKGSLTIGLVRWDCHWITDC